MRRFPFVLLCVLALSLSVGAGAAGASAARHAVRHAKTSPSPFVSKNAAKAYAAWVKYLVLIDSSYDQLCGSDIGTIQNLAAQERQSQGDGSGTFAALEAGAGTTYAALVGKGGLQDAYDSYRDQFKKTYGRTAKCFRHSADKKKLKRLIDHAIDEFGQLEGVELDICTGYRDLSGGYFDSADKDATDALTIRLAHSMALTADLNALKTLER